MSQTISKSLLFAKEQLIHLTDQPLLEAEVLLSHVLKNTRSYLHAWPEKELTHEQAEYFHVCMKRRCAKEPIAYIVGSKEFWSLDFLVSVDTLIPRPETELLVEKALVLVGPEKALVADLGTGSGAVGLALAHERARWKIYATDISRKALTIAKKNARRFMLNNVYFSCGNWCKALPKKEFDLIISNPPYIAESEWAVYSPQLAFEPYSALVSGLDGLQAIRNISQMALRYLKPSGYLLVEHGHTQATQVRDIFQAVGFNHTYSICDLSGRERVTVGTSNDRDHGLSL